MALLTYFKWIWIVVVQPRMAKSTLTPKTEHIEWIELQFICRALRIARTQKMPKWQKTDFQATTTATIMRMKSFENWLCLFAGDRIAEQNAFSVQRLPLYLRPTRNSDVIWSFFVYDFSVLRLLCPTVSQCPTLDVTFKSPLAATNICENLSLGIVIIFTIFIVRDSYGNRRLTSLSQLVIRQLRLCVRIPTRLTATICQPFSLTNCWHVCGE